MLMIGCRIEKIECKSTLTMYEQWLGIVCHFSYLYSVQFWL